MQKSQRTKYHKHDKYYWENHIATWQKSGLTQTEYCRQNRIPLTTFGNWKRNRSSDSNLASPFIELKGHLPVQEEYFEMQIDPDLTLRIRESIPPELLQNILMAVRGM